MLSRFLLTASIVFGGAPAASACGLDGLVGFTLEAVKIVDHTVKSGEAHSGFNGCDFDQYVVFTDGSTLKCSSYGYTYAYLPKMYLFVSGSLVRGCLENESTYYEFYAH